MHPSSNQFVDAFENDCASGGVIGSHVANGVLRKGVDRESGLSIDNGALRIRCLIKPGWTRAGLAYGPYRRENGLAFGVLMLNGHNTSQTGSDIEGLKPRMRRWMQGSESASVFQRLFAFVMSRKQKRLFCRRLQQWVAWTSWKTKAAAIDDNLAVGWFPHEVPGNPLREGNSIVMHALGAECGEVRVGSAGKWLQVIRGVQNVPIYYFIVLREEGAAYYAASIPGGALQGVYPSMQLLGIDADCTEQQLYAGIHQSVLGQIGFRVDSRVYGTQVVSLPGFKNWYGSAHGADRLKGDGPLHTSCSEIGGAWKVLKGSFKRSERGLTTEAENNLGLLNPGSPSGVVHLLIKTEELRHGQCVALVWRGKDEENYWAFELDNEGCRLLILEKGHLQTFPATRVVRLQENTSHSLQVTDDGEHIRLYVNGQMVYATLWDSRFNNERQVGFKVTGKGHSVVLNSFEAHPRLLPIPREFKLGQPWLFEGNEVVVRDEFDGPTTELSGRVTPVGDVSWNREIGCGEMRLTGSGAVRVIASVQEPCPGRTAYTIPWIQHEFADIEVRITPPGKCRGAGEKCRGGLIFWQDPKNYITLNVWNDDHYGFSISSFFHLDGFEELYDAVWTNVGQRLFWGVPFLFRVKFDGNNYLASINGEPVLYRALTDVYPDQNRLVINKVGIIANWEWGTDTGSTFENFVARGLV